MPIRNAGRYTIVILATRTERNGTHIVPTYSRCDRQRETIGAVDGAAQPSEEKIEAQVRRLRIFGQQDKLRADRSKGRETWA
jgi:hypothetical protein